MSSKNLNKTQKSAVEAIDGPVLIFAGAWVGSQAMTSLCENNCPAFCPANHCHCH